ncbi:MAG: hemerythrin family protein [Campylobacterota bacterium]|nr:hemerythrin family protein [Campylobacterota bacterium]
MMTQEQLPMVAMPSMNDTHLEDIILFNKLSSVIANRDTQAVTKVLNELHEHTIEHFAGEEKMMLEKEFPPYSMHKSEHENALAQMRHEIALWEQNHDFNRIGHYANVTLPQWLIQHVSTLDTVTAQFLVTGVSPCSM